MTTNNTTLMKWITYLMLSLLLIWLTNEIIVSYYSVKTSITVSELKKTELEQEKKYASDQVFYAELNALIQNKNYNKAEMLAYKQIKKFPEDESFILIQIGKIHSMKGEKDEAINLFTKVISKDNYNLYAYGERGWNYLDKNEIDKAISDFDFASKTNSNYFYDLGIAQERKKLYSEAKKSYLTYLEDYPKNIECKERLIELEKKIKK